MNSDTRETALPQLGKSTIRHWFTHRHDGDFQRGIARATIRDGQLWLHAFAGKPRRRSRRLGHA